MINERIYDMAKLSSAICGVPAEWIYAQWYHETGGFTSELYRDYNNFGGLTQEEENDAPQPDGNYYYMKFDSPEDYASYFGRYIKKYFPTAARATTMEDYAYSLKYGEPYVYYGDELEVYQEGMRDAHEDAFGS